MASQPKVSRAGDPGLTDDRETQAAIEAIDDVQNEIDKLNEQASEEILQVEQRYNKQRQPHYQKRAVQISKIPRFWLATFLNHPQLCQMISPEDEQVLENLTQVEVQEFDDIKSGYKISFHFADNQFFKNKVLVREFHMSEVNSSGANATKIEWFPGKDLTANKSRKSGQKRATCGAFFEWFSSMQDPSGDEYGEIIKDEIWPNPVQFYLMSTEDDEDEEGFNEEDEGGEEEEDEEGDE